MIKEEIKDFCESIVKKEKIEFIYSDNYKENYNIKKFGLSKSDNKESSGLSIRVIRNGQTGTYIITDISKKNILIGIEKAKKIAKLKNNIKIKDFGSCKVRNKIKQDKNIKEIQLTDILPELKKEITKEKYFKSYEGEISKNTNYKFYINPYLKNEYEECVFSLGTAINTKDKTISYGSYYGIFTRSKDIDIKKTIDQAKINAKNLINPVSGKDGSYKVIFMPEVVEEIFKSLILPATLGESLQKKESYLHNKLKKKVFSNKITIYEDPSLDYFLGSVAIDDEGFKTKKKTIIDKGIFNKAIYDQLQAITYNKKPTGNGFRNCIYSSINCEHTNIIQSPGRKKIEDVISNTKNGLLVYDLMGMHTSNLTNGDFSLVINKGKEIKQGKLKNTVTNLNFTGNCKDMFKDISFSKEQKFFGDSLYSFGVIDNVKLI